MSQWLCKLCDLDFATRRLQMAHNKDVGHSRSDFIDKQALRILATCEFCSREWETTSTGLSHHRRFCGLNPNREKHRLSGIPRTEAEKLLVSEAMKRRHEEGRASRWENPFLKESYAEAFFQRVIDNEFEDTNVLREMRFGRYSFDFAWLHKMKVIEIDGQQHDRYAHQRESDAKKDTLAAEAGWTILRIKWKDLYNNPKEEIAKAKSFVDD